MLSIRYLTLGLAFLISASLSTVSVQPARANGPEEKSTVQQGNLSAYQDLLSDTKLMASKPTGFTDYEWVVLARAFNTSVGYAASGFAKLSTEKRAEFIAYIAPRAEEEYAYRTAGRHVEWGTTVDSIADPFIVNVYRAQLIEVFQDLYKLGGGTNCLTGWRHR